MPASAAPGKSHPAAASPIFNDQGVGDWIHFPRLNLHLLSAYMARAFDSSMTR